MTRMAARDSVEGRRSVKIVKRLEGLQGVFFDAGPDGLLENGVQIDEDARAEQAVDFVFAGGVAAHQPFEFNGLVGREMVDMHGGIGVAPADDFVHDPFEGVLFFLGGERPLLFVNLLLIGGDKAE